MHSSIRQTIHLRYARCEYGVWLSDILFRSSRKYISEHHKYRRIFGRGGSFAVYVGQRMCSTICIQANAIELSNALHLKVNLLYVSAQVRLEQQLGGRKIINHCVRPRGVENVTKKQ